MRALLALEDGRIFHGQAIGHAREVGAEVVFNTSMTGYEEILTDPSYHGQIVVFTAPHVGNYGIHGAHAESRRVRAAGTVVREASEVAAHPDARAAFGAWLREQGVFGMTGVDTRALTLHLRRHGVLRGWMTTLMVDPGDAVARARAVPPMERIDAVHEVSTRSVFLWQSGGSAGSGTRGGPEPGEEPSAPGGDGERSAPASDGGKGPRVAVLDCGVKFGILRALFARGCQVTVLPADTEAPVVERLGFDGLVLSNGPGDPRSLEASLPRIGRLLERHPTLAICLGHQLAALALGCRIVRLPFGHHGGNHPVRERATGIVRITAQNHNYAIDPTSLPPDLEVTHDNLNDGTVEGIRHRTLPLWSLQYHPEASPGPHEAAAAFDDFVAALEGRGRS
jgi:carbamoyl-phosphate synthase small subunit